MKLFYWFVVTLTVGICFGCKRNSDTPATDTEATTASLFSERKGVLFSEESKKLLGVETAEVEEKPVQRSIERTAQVFRAGKATAQGAAASLIRSEDAKELKPGQAVTLRDQSGREWVGKLVLLDSQAEAALGGIEAVIEFADAEENIKVGAFLGATFNQGGPALSLVVPRAALLTGADGDSVYTVNGSYLTRTRVKGGMVCGDYVEIRDGLYAGDLVASKGVQSLWAVELSALKGGTPCCPVPKK